MKGKKDKNHLGTSNGAPVSSTKADTSNWESLLVGARSIDTGPVALTPGHGFSLLKPGASPATPARNKLSNGHVMAVAGALSAKPHESFKGYSVFASGASNWEKLAKNPLVATPIATATARASAKTQARNGVIATHANVFSPLPSNSKDSKEEKKKKKKRPRSGAGTEAARSVAKTKSHDKNGSVRIGSGPAGGKGGNQAGKKRRRDWTNDQHEGGGGGGGGGGGKHNNVERNRNSQMENTRNGHMDSQHQQHGHNIATKRPKPNILNLAFQAQKEAAELGKKEDKGHGKAFGAGGGVGGRGVRGKEQVLTSAEQAQYVGLDCEMVGVGLGGRRSALARCCMVDWEGIIIYDKHVVPNERVTDFRTFVSGVKAKHLRGGISLRTCQDEVAAILKGKLLVGHALHNDLKALLLTHPPKMTRDTAMYRPYQKAHGKAGGKLRATSLKLLSQQHLKRTIQEGQHHPAEDARAAMDLYKNARQEWEKSLVAGGKMRGRRGIVDQQQR